MDTDYEAKYKEYKRKYLELKQEQWLQQEGGDDVIEDTCPSYVNVRISGEEADEFVNNLNRKSIYLHSGSQLKYIVDRIREELALKTKQRDAHIELLSTKDLEALRQLPEDEQKQIRKQIVTRFRKAAFDINLIEKDRWKPIPNSSAFMLDLFSGNNLLPRLPTTKIGRRSVHMTVFNKDPDNTPTDKETRELLDDLFCIYKDYSDSR